MHIFSAVISILNDANFASFSLTAPCIRSMRSHDESDTEMQCIGSFCCWKFR